MKKWIVIGHTFIQKVLKEKPVIGEKHSIKKFDSFSVENNLPFTILETSKHINKAEIHKKADDVWMCLEGEAQFIIGGQLVDPSKGENSNELRGSSIVGGKKILLKPGDWLYIPAGQSHQNWSKTFSRLIIIKIPVSRK